MNSAHAPEEENVVVWWSSHCPFDDTMALRKQMPGSEGKKMKRFNREKQ
jgi:hypothetical protein